MLSGTVGRPLPGVQIDIKNPDASGVGEVIARGPNVMLGYFGNEEATRETLVDRWLFTGDLGRLDDDGNLYLVGRSKDIIVDTNGKNVYPDEVEEVYQDSPYVKELSVFGLPDGIGEKVACIVVAIRNMTSRFPTRRCASRSELPRSVSADAFYSAEGAHLARTRCRAPRRES